VIALLENEGGIFDDKIVLTSLCCSALLTGYSTTYLTYLKDIDVNQRHLFGNFYGFVPTSGDGFNVVRVSMLLMSVAQLLGKCVSVCVFYNIGGLGVVGLFFAVDVGLFFLIKLLRGDLRYWIPIQNNLLSWTMSIFARLVAKVVVDFTGMMHLRLPLEVGGAYWLFNQISTQASIFVAVFFYRGKGEGVDEFKLSLAPDELLNVALILSSIWLASFICLLVFCNPKYRKTFYSPKKAKDFIKDLLSSGKDEVRKAVFEHHREMYRCFDVNIVKWLDESWDRWHAEKQVRRSEASHNKTQHKTQLNPKHN